MKKIVFLIISFYAIPTFACDICGAGAGGSYIGLMPSFRKKFFGMRYQHNSLLHHLGPGGTTNYLTTTETYHTLEGWGSANFGSRFRVTAFVPYNFIQRVNQQERTTDQGIGDITLLGYYQLLKQNENNAGLKHALWVGGGAKLPTGKYNPEDKNIQQSAQNTFQLGTGSVDFSVNAMYDLSYKQTGMNVNIGYKVNTANKYDYKYGNKFTANTIFYRRLILSNQILIVPNAGLMLEAAAKDMKTETIRVWETGGYALLGIIGLEASSGKISTGVNLQTPLKQDLGEGKLKGRDRIMIHIGFAF